LWGIRKQLQRTLAANFFVVAAGTVELLPARGSRIVNRMPQPVTVASPPLGHI
jgi:hypothetical protein